MNMIANKQQDIPLGRGTEYFIQLTNMDKTNTIIIPTQLFYN